MKLFCILTVGLLLTTNCKKDPIKTLPKATQDGKNTMGCLVDGKAWTPKGSSGGLVGGSAVEPIFARWRRNRNGVPGGEFTLSFRRRQKDETQSNLSFFVPGLAQAGTVTLDQVADPFLGGANPAYGVYILSDETPDRYYLTGPQATGTLTVTRLDTVACIAAGTFSFTGRHAASGQTVQVTEGRFDVRFTKE